MTPGRRRPGGPLVVVAALVVTGCSAGGPSLVVDPHPVDEALPTVRTTDMQMPISFAELEVVDPGWDLSPQYLDGVYLAGEKRDGVLEFTAVDVRGDVLWSAERHEDCSGFAVTTGAQGRALAVLSDCQEDLWGPGEPTATAYDLTTGERVWGPVDVPGQHQGPGLVFSGPDGGAKGDTPGSIALDPSTGAVAAEETGAEGRRIIGEYQGTVVLADDDALTAWDTTGGEELWRVPLAEHRWSATSFDASSGSSPGEGLALVATSDAEGVLLDLEDGRIVSETARDAAVDQATGTLVVLDDTGLHAHDPDGHELWSLPAGREVTIAAVGGVLLYLREGDAVRVHNVRTGDVAEAYAPDGEGPIVVPSHITVNGAAVLQEDGHLMATIPRSPEPSPSP